MIILLKTNDDNQVYANGLVSLPLVCLSFEVFILLNDKWNGDLDKVKIMKKRSQVE